MTNPNAFEFNETDFNEQSSRSKLWFRLAVTPPAATRDFNNGYFTGKTIEPIYRIQTLTEVFGPCGIGWRFVSKRIWLERIEVSPNEFRSVAFCTGFLWYLHKGKRYRTADHTGGTVVRMKMDLGDIYKQSETDAFGKCCADLGLGADVYSGQHDGDKYANVNPGDLEPQGNQGRPQQRGKQAQATDPAAVDPPSDWREVEIHFGNDRGKKLGEITEKSQNWFAKTWRAKRYPQSNRNKNPDHLLAKAIDLMVAEKENSSQPPIDQRMYDSDEVPF